MHSTLSVWYLKGLDFIRTNWSFLIGVVIVLALAGTNPFSSRHVMRNLEPYPDGLFYTMTADNFIHGHGLNLLYQGTTLRPKIPPAYSLYLSPFYALPIPVPFYWANLLLALAGIWFLYLSLRNLTSNKILVAFGLIIYALHAYLAWFVTVPMSENLGVFLMTVILSQVTKPQVDDRRTQITLVVSAALLVLTKYVYLPISLVVLAWLGWQLLKNKKRPDLVPSLVTGSIFVAIFVVFLLYVGFNPFTALNHSDPLAAVQPVYFSLSPATLVQHLLAYTSLLLGKSGTILWLHYPLTTPAIVVYLVAMVVFLYWKKISLPQNWLWLLALAIAPLSMLAFFYSVDGRYIFTAIPVLVTLGVSLASQIKNSKYLRFEILVGVLLVFFQIISQLGFYKFILATNILLRSQAWQYQAAQQFGTVLADKPHAYLITALPPYLVQYYEQNQQLPRLLPLSSDQEFLDKGEDVWGSDIQYQQLLTYYTGLVRQGQTVYLTNAYITQSTQVIQDYQTITQNFTLLPLSTGCEGVCTIYQLQLKPSAEK